MDRVRNEEVQRKVGVMRVGLDPLLLQSTKS